VLQSCIDNLGFGRKSMHTTEETIRRFLIDNAWLEKDKALLRHDSLLEQGVIDSMAMLELVNFLEGLYDIEIPDDDLMPENFDSLASIVAYVDKKRQVVG
jgi:acyl carrier protein